MPVLYEYDLTEYSPTSMCLMEESTSKELLMLRYVTSIFVHASFDADVTCICQPSGPYQALEEALDACYHSESSFFGLSIS